MGRAAAQKALGVVAVDEQGFGLRSWADFAHGRLKIRVPAPMGQILLQQPNYPEPGKPVPRVSKFAFVVFVQVVELQHAVEHDIPGQFDPT